MIASGAISYPSGRTMTDALRRAHRPGHREENEAAARSQHPCDLAQRGGAIRVAHDAVEAVPVDADAEIEPA